MVQYIIFVRFHCARHRHHATGPHLPARQRQGILRADGPLVLHEYFHVMRQWATGDLTDPALSRWNASGAATGTIVTKIEAREFTTSEICRYRALLGAASPGRCRRACIRSAKKSSR